MNKKGIKLIAALTAGVFAVTGFVGLQAARGIASVETVEYAIEENAAYDSGNAGTIVSGADDLGDISIKSGQGYKYVYLKGLKGEALLVTDHPMSDLDNTSIITKVYVQKDGGPVVYVGELTTGTSKYEVSISDNGVLVVRSTRQFETYILSADGKRLEVKDSVGFVNKGPKEDPAIYSGYTRASDLNSPKVNFTGGENEFYNLEKTLFHSVEPSKFKVK